MALLACIPQCCHKQAGTVEDNPECPLEKEAFEMFGERSHSEYHEEITPRSNQVELSCLGDSGAECEL
jgi:hypothetical protein